MWQLKVLAFVLGVCFLGASGQIAITNPSVLTSDPEIKAGTTHVINCNADVVDVPSNFNFVFRLQIFRSLHGEQPDQVPDPRPPIAAFSPYFPVANFRTVTNFPPGRDWEVIFPTAPALPASGTPNSRNMNLELHIRDSECADAGIYQCQVIYVDPVSGQLPMTGEQNLTAIAGVSNNVLIVSPRNTRYTEDENVTMTCRADGPPNLQLQWYRRIAGSNIEEVFDEGSFLNEPPVMVPNNDCGAMSYQSSFTRELSLADDNYMFYCKAIFRGEELSRSGNYTLSISTAVVDPVDPQNPAPSTGGGTDVGVIVGPIIGVIALIIIILLLVYFCWYRKRNEDDDDKDKDAENGEKPEMHAPPPVFYSKPNKPPKDDRDNGTWGKDSDGGDTWGRKARYDTYDTDGKDDYITDRKPSSSSSKGGRRGRYGSGSSAVRDQDGYPSRSAYDEDNGYNSPESKSDAPDSRNRPRYEKRRNPRDGGATTTPDASTRSEDEASDAPLSGSYKPRPKRRTSRPSSRGDDQDDRKSYRRNEDDDDDHRGYRRGGDDRDDPRRYRRNDDQDDQGRYGKDGDQDDYSRGYRRADLERQGDPALHYAQLDLAPSGERGDRRGRRGEGRQGEAAVEYAEIRV